MDTDCSCCCCCSFSAMALAGVCAGAFFAGAWVKRAGVRSWLKVLRNRAA